MWVELAAAGYLLGRYIYHRITEDGDNADQDHKSFKIPATDSGEVVPLIYGRCRVNNPCLAWTSVPFYHASGFTPEVYQCNLFFILGVGMADGSGTNRLHNVYIGDTKLDYRGTFADGPGSNQTGDGNFESPLLIDKTTADGQILGGHGEFLNGNPSQVLVDAAGAALTQAGEHMMDDFASSYQYLPASRRAPASEVSGYRGYMSVFLKTGYGDSGIGDKYGQGQWRLGSGATIPSHCFECSSYPPGSYPWGLQIGPDCNPIDVIYDLIVAKFGKLGMDSSTYVDFDSFVAAATTLHTESHGYSRALEDPKSAEEWIMDVLKQIDAAMYEDPSTGKLKIKLIRNDYDPSNIPILNKDNCSGIENFAAGGWTGVINKLRLIYSNRDDDYRDATVTIQNMANAVGQDGIVREQVVRMPGITNQWLAWRVAERELQARSRPLIKLRAISDRSKIRLNQGDAVKLVWNDPDISLIFRVANVSHGVINDGKVAIDLIQDYFYTYRGSYPTGGGLVGGGEVYGPDDVPPFTLG